MNHLIKDQKTLPYVIVYKNNKNTYLRIKEDHVLITTNKHIKKSQIIKLLYERFDDFYNRIETFEKERDDEIKLEGHKYQLILVPGRKFSYQILEDKVIVTSNQTDRMLVKKRIYQAHILKMIEGLEPIVNNRIQSLNIDMLPIKIKYLKSKFGSYHRFNREITINSFLATEEMNYLLYVLLHEYAHVLVFNHSKAFYQTLEKLMPNYKLYHNALKKIAITR